MKTIEVSDDIARAVEAATDTETEAVLMRAAQELVDVTTMDMKGDRKFVHSMTGRTLMIRANWSD